MAGEEEKTKWTVGVGVGPTGLNAFVSREVDRMKKLAAKSKPKRSFFSKGEQSDTDDRELQDEFRAFLQTVKENVHLYLWYALSALADRNVDRKFEAKIYSLFGNVASSFLLIETNFDPSRINSELLDFLKERITKVASPGAYEVMGYSSTITQGDGERLFLNGVGRLDTMLTEMRSDLSKYFKRDEEFEKAREAAVAEAMKNR